MRLLAAAAASLAFTLVVIALLQGFAGLAGDSARAWMLVWQERGNVGHPAQWESAHERLQFARRFNPLNADYSADLGRLMEWRAWQQRPGSAESAASRVLADEFYREAISRRPSWGFAGRTTRKINCFGAIRATSFKLPWERR